MADANEEELFLYDQISLLQRNIYLVLLQCAFKIWEQDTSVECRQLLAMTFAYNDSYLLAHLIHLMPIKCLEETFILDRGSENTGVLESPN